MENKKLLLTFILLVFSLTCIWAKKKDDKIEGEENVVEFNGDEDWQILQWQEDEPDYVLYYEIIIEEKSLETSEYSEILRITTPDNKNQYQINPPLPIGNYRYKIINYDLLEMPAVESDWYNFSIFQSYQPVIEKIAANVNNTNVLYMEEDNDGVFTVTGENLFAITDNPDVLSYTKYELVNALPLLPSLPIEALEFDPEGKKFRFKIDMTLLSDLGKYYLIAVDKSGLRTKRSPENAVYVKFKKAFDLDISGGPTALAMLPIGTDVKMPGGGNLTESKNIYDFFPDMFTLGANTRITFIPWKTIVGYLGFGVQITWIGLATSTDTYDLTSNVVNASVNFVWQHFLYKKKLLLDVHGGLGAVSFLGMEFDFSKSNGNKTEKKNFLRTSISGGIALQYYLWKRLYIEADVEFVFAANYLKLGEDLNFFYLQPIISVGWQL